MTLTVEDEGPGISPKELPFLFEPYRRAHAPRQSGLSTGLGLSFCRQALSRMGGEIQAEAASRGGAKFLIRLPAAMQGS